MPSIFQRGQAACGGLDYGVRLGKAGEDAAKNDGTETHSQQDDHKGALFLREP